MCGIAGVFSKEQGNGYAGLKIARLLVGQQHRGRSSTGVAWIRPDDNELILLKNTMSPEEYLKRMKKCLGKRNKIAIGHNRMPSVGAVSKQNAHPFVGGKGSFALAHNGTNLKYDIVKTLLKHLGHNFKGETDSEVYVHLLEEFLNRSKTFEEGIKKFYMAVKDEHEAFIILDKKNERLYGIAGDVVRIKITQKAIYVMSDTSAYGEISKNGKEKDTFLVPKRDSMFKIDKDGVFGVFDTREMNLKAWGRNYGYGVNDEYYSRKVWDPQLKTYRYEYDDGRDRFTKTSGKKLPFNEGIRFYNDGITRRKEKTGICPHEIQGTFGNCHVKDYNECGCYCERCPYRFDDERVDIRDDEYIESELCPFAISGRFESCSDIGGMYECKEGCLAPSWYIVLRKLNLIRINNWREYSHTPKLTLSDDYEIPIIDVNNLDFYGMDNFKRIDCTIRLDQVWAIIVAEHDINPRAVLFVFAQPLTKVKDKIVSRYHVYKYISEDERRTDYSTNGLKGINRLTMEEKAVLNNKRKKKIEHEEEVRRLKDRRSYPTGESIMYA